MTTISVSLDDETYARLKVVAEAEGVSVEDLVVRVIRHRFPKPEDESEAAAMSVRHLSHYPNRFRRLAE